jgi:hypothetical protein
VPLKKCRYVIVVGPIPFFGVGFFADHAGKWKFESLLRQPEVPPSQWWDKVALVAQP